MADDIITRLGFDAGGAITTINSLKTSLDGLNQVLQVTGKEIRTWNTGGAQASKMFASMEKTAKGLLAQFNALAGAQAKFTGGFQTTLPAGGIESQLNLIKQLTSAWGNLPVTADAASRQAFASGIAGAAQFAQTNKLSAQQVVQAFTTMGTGTSGPVAQLGARLKALAATHATAAKQVVSGNQQMTVSFGTLVRILQFRVIIGAISGLSQAFKQGATDAAAFSRQLGLIQTITEKGANIDKIEQDLLRLSATFARPIADVGEGYYLTLQNQVGDSAESMEVLEAAMQLAVATGATTKNSVDTLTVAINGFKLGTENARDTAAKLFKAVDIGRFELDEMQDSMGRVNAIAESLSIRFEEILGPLATMTRQGVGFGTAVTQMRAVITQLLKPTERLKEVFKEKWGVEDVEQAIAKFGGLLPMLKALETELGGNNAEISKAFTNTRAYTGVMSTLGKNYQESLRDTKAITEANKELLTSVSNLVQKTPGQEFAQLTTQITNNFTKMGKEILPILNSVLKVVEAVTASLKQLSAPALWVFGGVAAAASAMAIYNLYNVVKAIKAVQIAAIALRGAFLPLAAVAAAYALGVGLGKLVKHMTDLSAEARKLNKDLIDQEKKYAKEVEKIGKQEVESRLEANKLAKNGIVLALTEIRRVQNEVMGDLVARNKVAATTLKGQLEGVLNTQKKIVDKLRETAIDGGKDMVDALRDYNDSVKSAAELEFKFRTEGLDDTRKAYAQMERSQNLMNAALGKLSTARTREDFDAIKKDLADAARTASDASSSAQSEKNNRVLVTKTRQQEIQIAKAVVGVDRQQIALLQQRQKLAPKTYKEELARYNDMKTAVEDIKKGYSRVTKKGLPKTAEQLKTDFQAGQVAFKKLQALLGERGKDLSFFDVKDLSDKLDAVSGQLPALKTQIEFEYAEELAKLQTIFDNIPITIKTKFQLDATDPIGQLLQGATSKTDELAKLEPEVQKYTNALQKMQNVIKTRVKPFDQLVVNTDLLAAKATPLNFIAKAYADLLLKVQALGKADPSNLEAFQKALTEAGNAAILFDKSAAPFSEKQLQKRFGVDPNTAQMLKDSIIRVWRESIDLIKASPGLEAKVDTDKIKSDLEEVRQFIGTGVPVGVTINKEVWSNVKLEADSIKLSSQNINTAWQGTATATATAADNIERAMRASQNIRTPVAQAAGGIMRYAAGGKAHGTDSIPAMLSPGEFVVNARSTRRFFSQLVAMNAGVKPLYRQDGGAVTNIGDINVTVSGGTSARQTARETATALRRELRRGTSRL